MLANKIPALCAFIREQSGAEEVSAKLNGRLGGGAIQQNWSLDLVIRGGPQAGEHRVVLRGDSPSGVGESWKKAEEFALLGVAYRAGVTVPEPLWSDADGAVTGVPFLIARRLPGSADPRKLVRAIEEEEGEALVAELGAELAKLHSITPSIAGTALGFLPQPPADLISARLKKFRDQLDNLPEPQPVLEWAINRLEDEAPNYARGMGITLCHRDFRSGNYLVENGKLSGLLDFEFAGWSDPYEDLGWFCARCWRFGMMGAEAGGIGSREAFYRGYAEASGRDIDDGMVRFWEQMAAVRWAIIAQEQAERHLSGRERSIELALTGLVALEMEYDLLVDLRLPGFKPASRKSREESAS